MDPPAGASSNVSSGKYRIREIFYPYTDQRSRELLATDVPRVAYYTTAETGFQILRNKEFWLRNTATMNDFLEVEHGFECLKKSYRSESGELFQRSLEDIFPGAAARAVQRLDDWLPGIRQETFIACFSEHLSSEDSHGRLSMWRAYGGRAGIALILKPDIMFAENDGIGVFAMPVAYWTQEEFEAEYVRIAERINSNAQYVSSLGSASIENIVFNMLRSAVLCTKHPGFAEEREWRVIASPQMFPSPLLRASVEVVRGVPQTVQKVSLRDYNEIGLDALEPKRLIDRIIVGPCEYPSVIARALYQLLLECGVDDPASRIAVSDIPLRASI